MNKRAAITIILAGLALAGCGADKAHTEAATPAAAAQSPAEQIAEVIPAAPVATIAAPVAKPATVKPAAVATTTTTLVPAPVVAAEATTTTTTTMSVVPEPTTTTTVPAAPAPQCGLSLSQATASVGDEMVATITSNMPGTKLRFEVMYPKFGTGKPNPRQTYELVSDQAGGVVKAFNVTDTSTVPVSVSATFYSPSGGLYYGEGNCKATFESH